MVADLPAAAQGVCRAVEGVVVAVHRVGPGLAVAASDLSEKAPARYIYHMQDRSFVACFDSKATYMGPLWVS